MRRLTSRAELIRQSSVAILRDASTSYLRKYSMATLMHEDDDVGEPESRDITLLYVTGWQCPKMHFQATSEMRVEEWTPHLGYEMDICRDDHGFDISDKDKDSKLWIYSVPMVKSVEFVLHFGGRFWDKAPGNRNYVIEEPGVYLLHKGVITRKIPPPGKPALLRSKQLGSSTIELKWNPPIYLPQYVTSYILYRNDEQIAVLGEDDRTYVDTGLMGSTTYTYTVASTNANGVISPVSDTEKGSTAKPGLPTRPRGLVVVSETAKGISLRWKPPVDNGGALVEYYRIYRDGAPHKLHRATVSVAVSDAEEQWMDVDVSENEVHLYHISSLHAMPKIATHVADTLERLPSLGEEKDVDDIAAPFLELIEKYRTESEGEVSRPVIGRAKREAKMVKLYDRDPHIILQSFNWESAKNPNGWWTILKANIERMRDAAITIAWLPPPSASVSLEGYMPTKWNDYNSRYGTTAELLDLTSSLEASDIAPMIDLVVNHRCGSKKSPNGEWTTFEDPDWGPWAIVSNNRQGYHGTGAADTGATSDCAPDIDHTNKKVREDIRTWLNELFKRIGFRTIRFDMAPGYNVGYQLEYLDAVGGPLAIGEYWSGDVNVLHNYVSQCRGRIAAYDFAFYYVLRRCVERNEFHEMSRDGKLNGLVGRDPERSVTFLDNHDTVHLDFVGRFAGGDGRAILRGYAILLTHPGVPSIFWDHFSDYGDDAYQKLKSLGEVRRDMKILSTSGVCIKRADHIYAAYIAPNDRHAHEGNARVAVKVGFGDWGPNGGGWTYKASGDGWCVWTK